MNSKYFIKLYSSGYFTSRPDGVCMYMQIFYGMHFPQEFTTGNQRIIQ